MKQIFVIFSILILLNTNLMGQAEYNPKPEGKEKLPDSWINVGIGSGMTYGGIGTKTVIGARNSGLLIGLGYMIPGTIGYEIGAQASFNWFYFNVGYGRLGTIVVNDVLVEEIEAVNINIGAMINLGREKRTFIDIGAGFTAGAETVQLTSNFTAGGDDFTLAIGIGRRLGDRKRGKE